jgi:hypothetical protein
MLGEVHCVCISRVKRELGMNAKKENAIQRARERNK